MTGDDEPSRGPVPAGPRRHVTLVGPWRGTVPGGCCAATADALGVGERERRDRHPAADPGATAGERRQVADVLAAVRAAVPGDVDVQLVDPRNSLYLLPTVYRAARRNGTGPLAACRIAVLATTPWTLIVDGRILSRSRPLSPDTARTLLTPECDGSGQPRDARDDGPRVA